MFAYNISFTFNVMQAQRHQALDFVGRLPTYFFSVPVSTASPSGGKSSLEQQQQQQHGNRIGNS